MSILKNIEDSAASINARSENVVITYSTKEGLASWWAYFRGFPVTPDSLKGLLFEENGHWWLNEEVDDNSDYEWASFSLEDPNSIEFGPYPFVMTLNSFQDHYASMHMADMLGPSKQVTGISWGDFMEKCRRPESVVKAALKDDPDYPITFKVLGNEFKTMEDVEKFIRFDKLRNILTKGLPEETAKVVIQGMVNNKQKVLELLKGL